MKNLMQPAIVYSDGRFVVAWSTEAAYAELEFDIATSRVGWFTKDRKTGKYKGSEDDLDYIPAEFLSFIMKYFMKEG